MKALVLSPFVSQRIVPFVTSAKREDLIVPKDLIEAGKRSLNMAGHLDGIGSRVQQPATPAAREGVRNPLNPRADPI
jgi:hypothetical protein